MPILFWSEEEGKGVEEEEEKLIIDPLDIGGGGQYWQFWGTLV